MNNADPIFVGACANQQRHLDGFHGQLNAAVVLCSIAISRGGRSRGRSLKALSRPILWFMARLLCVSIVAHSTQCNLRRWGTTIINISNADGSGFGRKLSGAGVLVKQKMFDMVAAIIIWKVSDSVVFCRKCPLGVVVITCNSVDVSSFKLH